MRAEFQREQRRSRIMKKLILPAFYLLLSGPVLSGPALAESVGETTGVNSMMGISPSTADFIKEATMSNMFEIQSSQLAEQKSVDPKVKAFAEEMVKDHSKADGELKQLVSSGSVSGDVPAKLDSSHQSMLDKLKGLDGSQFAKAYEDDQESGHKDAVSLFKRYADGGDNPKLKDWAAKTLPTIQAHLKMADALDGKTSDKTPVSNE
jgi:putative membrane protein